MATWTDPARELGDLADHIMNGGKRGDQHLATAFGVKAWSREFYQIIFCIVERIDFVSEIIGTIDADDDWKAEAISHLEGMKEAFAQQALMNQWNGNPGGITALRPNVQPVKMLSTVVRQKVRYPKLDEAEVEEILGMVENLLTWLDEHQLHENDFIRQALIDGLKQFQFRLTRVQWLGWGYTAETLRDVISAYMALEKGIEVSKGKQPVAEVALKMVGELISAVFDKAKLAKDISDTAVFALKAYQTVSSIAAPTLAGLLAYSGPS